MGTSKPMVRLGHVVAGFATLGIVFGCGLRAAAAQPMEAAATQKKWAWTFELATYSVPREIIGFGYAGPNIAAFVSLERVLLPKLRLDAQVGFVLPIGPLVAASARFAFFDRPDLTLEIGAGPAVDPVNRAGGPIYFASFDLSGEIRTASGMVFLLRMSEAFAVASPRARQCGVDACEPYVAAGDALFTARIGLGHTF
jgi:hypothetical protein